MALRILALLLILLAGCENRAVEGVSRKTEREVTPASSLSPILLEAIKLGDPIIFADTNFPRLADLTETQLHEFARAIAPWPAGHRVAAYAFMMVGAPYVLGPLGEESGPDSQPLIRFDVADCATLNLVAESLAHLPEAGTPEKAMANANYRDGVVSYASRLHFTTDRLDASPYDRDITVKVTGDLAESAEIVLNRKRDGTRWIDIAWERPRTIHYLPMAHASKLGEWFDAERIPSAIGVAFVQKKFLPDGLDVVHESLLWEGRTLLHGSSRIGRVVTISWEDFLKERGKSYDGIVLFEYL